MNDVFVLSAARTPVGTFLGALAPLSASRLGAVAIKAALERAEVPASSVSQVWMGNVLQAGQGQAPARQAALAADLPPVHRLHHGPQGLRVRYAGGDGRRERAARRRIRRGRRRRHGVHVERAVPPSQGPLRPAHGPRPDSRLDDLGRPLGSRTRTSTWATARSCARRSTRSRAKRRTRSRSRATSARAARTRRATSRPSSRP